MKKILTISIILFLVICLRNCVSAKSTCNIDLNLPKTTMSKSEEFTVEIAMSNIQSEKGIIAIGAVLEYDKNSIELIKMEGENGWTTPLYNEKNGKLVVDKNELAKKDEVIFKIIFKIKEQSQKNISIILKDITVADGNEETKIGNSTKIITVKDGNEETKIENSIKTITVKDGIQNELETAIPSKVLPKTGDNNIGIMILSIMAILYAVTFYIKLKG